MDIDEEVRKFAALKKREMQDFMREKNKDIPAFRDRMRTTGNVADLVVVYRRYLEGQEPEEEGDDSNADDDVGESSKSAVRRPSRTSPTSSATAASTTQDAVSGDTGDESDVDISTQDSDSMPEQIDVESKRSTSRSTFPSDNQVTWPNSFSARERAIVRKHVKKYLSDKPLLYTKKATSEEVYGAGHDLTEDWPLPFGKVSSVAQLAFFDVVCKHNSWDWPYVPPDEPVSSDAAPSQSEDEGAEDEDAEETAPKKGSKAAGKRPREAEESHNQGEPAAKARRILRGHGHEEERGRARVGHKATSAGSSVSGSRHHGSSKVAALNEPSAVEEEEEDGDM
ncbi:hypothetical protein P3342_011059 [Pyrenophora teres f. teres]|nr:hypothetical protein P3342_011059 [Pyrenophora teres f. teres]